MALRAPAWSSIPAHAWPTCAPPRGARRRGRFLEALLVAVIIGILLTAQARVWPPLTVKLVVLEAVSLFNAQRADAMAFRATTGRLPPEAAQERATRDFAAPHWQDEELVFPATGRLLQHLVENGAVEPGAEPAVSFRVGVSESGGTVWLCGRRDAPAGFTAPPTRHTTIPERYLLHFCRSATLAP